MYINGPMKMKDAYWSLTKNIDTDIAALDDIALAGGNIFNLTENKEHTLNSYLVYGIGGSSTGVCHLYAKYQDGKTHLYAKQTVTTGVAMYSGVDEV